MLFVAFFKLLLSNEVQLNYYRHHGRRLVGSCVQTLKGLGIRKGEQKIVGNEMGVARERFPSLVLCKDEFEALNASSLRNFLLFPLWTALY